MGYQAGLCTEVLVVGRHSCRIQVTWAANHASFGTPNRLYRMQAASLMKAESGMLGPLET